MGTGLVAFLRSKKPLTPSPLALVPIGSPVGTLPILRRCHSKLFFECGMKMTLTGKAQEFADRTDRFIRVLQQFFSFFQFAT